MHLNHNISGTTPKPCGIVKLPEAGFVNFIIEKPAVVFADTVAEILPVDESTEPAPFAFQFHDTIFSPLLLTEPSLPTPNPSLSKLLNWPPVPVPASISAPLLFETKFFPAPLTASNNLWFWVEVLFFIQTQSGWNPTPVIDCVEPLPV